MTRGSGGGDGGSRGRREFLQGVGAGMATLVVGCGGRMSTEEPGPGEGGFPGVPGTGGASTGGAGPSTGGTLATGGSGAGGRAGAPNTGGAPSTGGASNTGGAPDPSCSPTTADIEGPYYREGIPVRGELDLYGEIGPRLTLSGVVLDASCSPIQNAIVEIWNADTAGAYDTATQERRYYGQVATGADGSYSFHTVLPGRYLNGAQYRPRHVHMKVWMPLIVGGAVTLVERLTTQIYFEGDPYNSVDPWWTQSRTVALEEPVVDSFVGQFDVQGILRPQSIGSAAPAPPE